MAYKFRCNTCNHVFTSHSQSATCPRHDYRGHSSSFLGEVLEAAVDVAVAYVVADVVSDVVGGMFDGFFD